MPDTERKKLLEKTRGICANYCGRCPSYEGTGETQLLFCFMGKSKKITKEKGCMCPECPVQTDMMHLRWTSYCTRGSGKQQMAKNEE